MDVTIETGIPEGITADPMVPALFCVDRVKQETEDTFTVGLVPDEANTRFSYMPGQFNMLYVFGVGEVPISISGDPSVTSRLEHTTRRVGVVTTAMGQLRAGDMIGVRGPYGTHWPVTEEAGRDVLIVAGGIGLAPLRPVLYLLMAHREKYRKIVLLYGARSPEEILYKRELERWRGKFDLEVQVTVDRGSSAWRGNVGVVTPLVARAPFTPSNTIALLCGPEIMMRFAVNELQKRGVPADRTYLSLERNMKCAVGFCGHCQYGSMFVCKDGPVFRLDQIAWIFGKAEV
ncbi:MAG TPA: FAD/NAD(P)-binding protein [Candidatus Saccharimonadales bacterium]|nr:FAD/NAD(P)-binding protein [Candidatus Saccharimonadales bacterium]